MFTNQNLIIVATILCGLLSILAILFNYLSKRERKIRVKDEQELIISVKDSINAHTNQQVTDMEKRLLDRLEESMLSVEPLTALSITKKIDLLTKLQSSSQKEIEAKIQATNKLITNYIKNKVEYSDNLADYLDHTFSGLRKDIKNIKIVKSKIEDDSLSYAVPTNAKTKKCLYCKEAFEVAEGKGSSSRKFCKSKHGRVNYCRDAYNGTLKIKKTNK